MAKKFKIIKAWAGLHNGELHWEEDVNGYLVPGIFKSFKETKDCFYDDVVRIEIKIPIKKGEQDGK